MRLVRSISALERPPHSGKVVTIGAFDGLHLGHQEIFRVARGIAFERGQSITALSFEPTPAEYFARSDPPSRLTCFRERYERLAEIGIDELVCPHFREVSTLEHRRFVDEVLVEGLGVSHVVVGHDFRYGAARRGDIDSLASAGEAAGFGLTVVDAVYVEGGRVSSTRIREALESGDLDSARRMLGRDYSMSGRVVHGLGLGRDLGFPTANVNLKRRKAPVDGIFAVQVDGIADRPIDGVASIGSRPTVGGGKTLLEVYLFGFDSSIYGAYITVRFKQRLRSERHFDTIEAMQEQMQADVVAAKAALAERIA
ncbi:MAG: bifunctional riboflavin kinase/FAD synthetase [Gammaproteobacteria bacterium]|jgi:riboflavin kinase/FMN adenylyltransferase